MCSSINRGITVKKLETDYRVWYAVSFDQATDNVKAGCGRLAIDALTIPKSHEDFKNTWKNKWPISCYHIPSMCRYCWVGRQKWWGAARMAQGLASPVMAYLSLTVSISTTPEHTSGLRAVGCRGAGRGSRCHSVLGEGRCPVTRSSEEQVKEGGGNCTPKRTFHMGNISCLTCCLRT